MGCDWDKEFEEENNGKFDDNDSRNEQKAGRVRSLWKEASGFHIVSPQVRFILAQTALCPCSSMHSNAARVRAEKHTAHMLSARHIAPRTLLAN